MQKLVMKLKCKKCDKITRHTPEEKHLKTPRIFHNAYKCTSIIVRDVFQYRCVTCQTIYGHKPKQSVEEIKGLLPA